MGICPYPHAVGQLTYTLCDSHAVRSAPCPPGLALYLALAEGLGNVLLGIILAVNGLVLCLQHRHDLKQDIHCAAAMRGLQVRLSTLCYLAADRRESMQRARQNCSAAAHRLQQWAAGSVQHAMQGRDAGQPPDHGLEALAAQVASKKQLFAEANSPPHLCLGAPRTLQRAHLSVRTCRLQSRLCRTSGNAAARAVTAKGVRVTQGAAHLMRQQGRCLHWCSCHRLQRQRIKTDSIACALLKECTRPFLHVRALTACSSKPHHKQQRHMQCMRINRAQASMCCLHIQRLLA